MERFNYVVVLGPINDYDQSVAAVPSARIFKLISKSLCVQHPQVHFYLIGKPYSTFGSLIQKCPNVTIVPDDPHRIFRYPTSSPPTTPFTKPLEFLQHTDQAVLFLYNDDRLVKNPYDVLAVMKSSKINNRFFAKIELNAQGKFGLNVTSLVDTFSPVGYRQPQAAAELTKMTPGNREVLKNIILEGIDLLRFYIFAGFHLRQNLHPIPGWCFQVNGRWISLVLSVLQIETITPDLEHRQEIVSFACYRETLFYASLAVLSNFIVKFNIVSLDQLREIRKEASDDDVVVEEPAAGASDYLKDGNIDKMWISKHTWDKIRNIVAEKNF
jgi:hypothetical protein